MNVLWLASWFPNRTSPYNGDFIERHADAVAPFVDKLFIIAIVKDDAMKYKEISIEKRQKNNQTIYTVYYGRSRWGGGAEKLFSYKKYIALQQKVYRLIVAENGQPDIVHVQVPMKSGLFAMQLKKNFGIPYVVTEHWAGYSKQAKHSIFTKGRLFIWLNNLVLKKADLFTPVSNDLGKTVAENFVKISYEVVPNVLDTSIFYPAEKLVDELLHLVHISNMDFQKNPEMLIEAIAILQKQGVQLLLQLYGPVQKKLQQLVVSYELQQNVSFMGEVPQATLALAMQQADALVLCSRYESFGCVLIEANACGLPVIVSNLPVFHELIANGVNGLFVNDYCAEALADSLLGFAKQKNNFDKNRIASVAKERYSYSVVGQKIFSIYSDILRKKK